MISKPVIYKFFKDFTNHRKKTNRVLVFSYRLFPNILKKGTTDQTFQQSGKQESFRHLFKNSTSMYESSGSHFFKTTTEIQSKPDAFDNSRFVMTFLTVLVVCKFGSFKNPFAMVTVPSKFYFRFRRFVLLIQTKKNDSYELWQQHKQLKTMELS